MYSVIKCLFMPITMSSAILTYFYFLDTCDFIKNSLDHICPTLDMCQVGRISRNSLRRMACHVTGMRYLICMIDFISLYYSVCHTLKGSYSESYGYDYYYYSSYSSFYSFYYSQASCLLIAHYSSSQCCELRPIRPILYISKCNITSSKWDVT